MNWFQKVWNRRLRDQPEPQQPGGLLAKHYGENLKDPDALIHRANKRAMGGDIDGAFADFTEAIELSPARATAFYNRGFLHNTLGNFEAAAEDFNRTLEILPDYDEAYYQRGNSRLQLKDFPAATQDFSRAIQINPYSIKAYYKRAEAFADSGDFAGALADYTQAITRVPKDANAYYQRGRFLSKIGEMQSAVEDFSTAIHHNPRHADAYCSRGCCYAELGDMKLASQDFNQALLHNPSHQAAYYQRVYSLGILKDTAMSLQALNQTLPPVEPPPAAPTITPVLISAERIDLTNLSLSHLEIHPPTVKLEPENLMGFFERATRRAMNGDVDGAIADYTKVIELDPHNTQAYYQRGQSYSSLGQNDAALQDLNQAIHWTRVHSLGQLRDFSGALSETIETLKTELNKPKSSEKSTAPSLSIEEAIAKQTRLILEDPENSEAYFRRAQSRALMGDLKGAISDYSETIRLNPEHSEAYYRRALHRSALGDSSGSTQDFNQAIRHKPSQGSSQPSFGSSPESAGNAKLLKESASSNPSRYCDHSGNRANARFCIHCGEPLVLQPTQPLPPSPPASARWVSSTSTPATSLPNLSEAEALLQLGLTRCRSGNFDGGLSDLGNALQLFLAENDTVQYLETLKAIQQFSKKL